MSYFRKLLPRIYTDTIAHMLLRGENSPWTDVNSQLASGSNLHQLSDSMPNIRCVFDTSGEATNVLLKIDFGAAEICTFIAILNHNLKTCGTELTVLHNTLDSYATASPVTLIPLAGEMDGDEVDSDGSHLMVFTGETGRYWWIELNESAATFADDIEIGQILIGRYWTATHGPDIGSTRSVDFDGVQVSQTWGGVRHATVSHLVGGEDQSAPFGQPFRTDPDGETYSRHAGRRVYSANLSYLADTTALPSDIASGIGTVQNMTDVFSRTGGRALPFIFTPDSTSTVQGDYMWGRFASDTLDITEVSHNFVNVKLDIEEDF